MKIEKEEIVKTLKAELKQKLELAQASLETATKSARSTEMKSESKWDTRGIEAGYLASAQKKRVTEIESEVAAIEKMKIIPQKQVAVGALAKTDLFKEPLFFTEFTGGIKLKINQQNIRIISLNSLLGEAMIGLNQGDDFEFQEKDFQIISLY